MIRRMLLLSVAACMAACSGCEKRIIEAKPAVQSLPDVAMVDMSAKPRESR